MLHIRLHAKFLVLVVGSLALLLGALSFIIIQRETRLLTEKNIEEQHTLAHAVSQDLRESMQDGNPRRTLSLLRRIQGTNNIVRIGVLRRDGTPAFRDAGARFMAPQLDRVFETGEELSFRENGDRPLNTVLFPLKNDGDCRSCHRREGPVLGVILVSHSLEETLAEIAASRRDLTAFFAVIITVIGAVLYAVTRKIVLRPIETLSRGAEAIGKGDFSHRVQMPTRDEFRDVSEAFNQMAGRLTDMYSGLEDIVKARTRELDESFRMIRGIVASMPGGVMYFDMAGRVKLINEYASQMLQCRQTDVIGRELAAVIPETAAFVAASFDKADSGPYQEVELSRSDGTAVPLGFSSTYYRGAMGGYEGVIVMFRDLSDLKALQAELLKKERFAAMGRVVAGVAHEVRNPLFGISSIGQIFERELTNPAHRELVQALLSESRRLNHLVEDLLLYGRTTRLKLEPCELRRLWQDVLELYRDETLTKGVRMAGDDGAALPWILADQHQVRQVFLNLFRNALDASPPGTEIAVRFLIADRYLTFEIRDEGDGIPAENRGKIFDLFFTTKPKGTGLGLAICKKIVEDHGGDIAIESAEGTGTTVTVRFPYRKAAERRDAPNAG